MRLTDSPTIEEILAFDVGAAEEVVLSRSAFAHVRLALRELLLLRGRAAAFEQRLEQVERQKVLDFLAEERESRKP